MTQKLTFHCWLIDKTSQKETFYQRCHNRSFVSIKTGALFETPNCFTNEKLQKYAFYHCLADRLSYHLRCSMVTLKGIDTAIPYSRYEQATEQMPSYSLFLQLDSKAARVDVIKYNSASLFNLSLASEKADSAKMSKT